MPFTINQIRDQLTAALNPLYGKDEAGQMIKLLFDHFCGMAGGSLALRKSDLVSEIQYNKLREALGKLLDQTPIQYILGSTWFYNLTFEVNPAVLIPRPETEEMVDLIVKRSSLESISPVCGLLDVGTGSGCIAVALKKSFPAWEVSACDTSEEALQVAGLNAERAGTGINFFRADILHWKEWPDNGSYNLIVSNPPYVCEHEKAQMLSNVLEHEPALALFVPDDDPLVFYRAIAEFAAFYLEKNGKLYLEINENFGMEIVKLMKKHGYSGIELLKDFRGKDRFVFAGKV